jgi:hypothetical protein
VHQKSGAGLCIESKNQESIKTGYGKVLIQTIQLII